MQVKVLSFQIQVDTKYEEFKGYDETLYKDFI